MKKIAVISLHFGFWVFFIFAIYFALDLWLFQELVIFKKAPMPFSSFGNGMRSDEPWLTTWIYLVVCFVLPFYLSYFFIKPKLINNKKYLLLFIIFVAIITLFSLIFVLDNKSKTAQPVALTIVFLFVSISFISGVVIKYLIDYGELKRQKELAEKHQTDTELVLLKSQLNPHFLFNTLNNIDILILKDAEKASIYLQKLSDIMRFMLYETSEKLISLSLEIDYIRRYIDLQKIRTSNSSYINFTSRGKVEGLKIAPMIFIPFIENAFKHTSNKKMKDAIKIQFDFSTESVQFTCENYKNNKGTINQTKSGLGINLITQRLNLLYKDKYTLEIENTDNKYFVSLNIDLNEN